jgi:hypothetical protein
MTSANAEILNSIDRLPTQEQHELMVEVLRRLPPHLLAEHYRLYQGRFHELKALIQVGIDQLDRGERVDGKTAIEQLKQRNSDRLIHEI